MKNPNAFACCEILLCVDSIEAHVHVFSNLNSRESIQPQRAVESELLDKYGVSKTLRPVIMRPSLIYTPRKWASLPAVAAFQVGNSIGLPGVDRPVLLDTLAKAVVKGIQDPTVMGIHNYKGMEKLAGLQ